LPRYHVDMAGIPVSTPRIAPARSYRRLVLGLCVLLAPAPAPAGVVELPASRDNTLFDVAVGAWSNGAGPYLYVGKTSTFGVRRTLLHFDVASAVPFGVQVDSVQLLLRLTRSVDVQPRTLALHRVVADWGEAGSNSGAPEAGGGGGRGAAAEPGDATWTHRFWPTDTWAAPGGDFAPVASAAIAVSGMAGTRFAWSGAGLVADVQTWLDAPATNFGWILIGDESPPAQAATARRFGAREHAAIGDRPVLVVAFTTTAVEPQTWSGVKALLR
jgi:hypothetical protein